MGFTGDKGSNGNRSLAYWLAYADLIFGDDSPATKFLQEKIEEQGENEIVARLDHEMTALLLAIHDKVQDA